MSNNIFFLTESKRIIENGVHICYGVECNADEGKIIFADISKRSPAWAFWVGVIDKRISPS